VGAASACEALDRAISAAFAAAGLQRVPVAAACLGLAGAGRAPDQEAFGEWAERTNLSKHVEVTTDVAILLSAGTPDGWGVALVAGTGSIAYGRHSEGRTARAGGWGNLLGDEGSGYALVLAALRGVARAADGRGEPTRLSEDLLKACGAKQPQDLIRTLYQGSWDRARLAGLAPLVFAAAGAGDSLASRVVADGARELAAAVASVARQLDLVGAPVPLALAGGLLLQDAGYRQALLDAIGGMRIEAEPVSLVQEPAEGALRRAKAVV
jgi:N-acetylglucosamine kinase-like BadF-type ATPase